MLIDMTNAVKASDIRIEPGTYILVQSEYDVDLTLTRDKVGLDKALKNMCYRNFAELQADGLEWLESEDELLNRPFYTYGSYRREMELLAVDALCVVSWEWNEQEYAEQLAEAERLLNDI